MRKVAVLLLAVFLVVLGFNTLDMMMWHPRREHPWLLPIGQWNMGPFWIGDWYAYIFFGILSLSVGCFILGWIANGRNRSE